MNDHRSLVEGYIHMNIEEVAPVDIIDAAHWDTGVDLRHAPYGYLVPADGVRRFSMCPELIARHVAHLEEPEAMDYLGFLEQHLMLHLVHHESELTGDDLEAFIDGVIYNVAPRASRRGCEIMAQALEANRV